MVQGADKHSRTMLAADVNKSTTRFHTESTAFLFPNDLDEKMANYRHLFYADDLQIYRTCTTDEIEHCIDLINKNIPGIRQ